MFDNVVLAKYHCRYDWQSVEVKDIQDGIFYSHPCLLTRLTGAIEVTNPWCSESPKPRMQQIIICPPNEMLVVLVSVCLEETVLEYSRFISTLR